MLIDLLESSKAIGLCPLGIYADDTIVFDIGETSFQKNLGIFYECTKVWKLDINYVKTKDTHNNDHVDSKMPWARIKFQLTDCNVHDPW